MANNVDPDNSNSWQEYLLEDCVDILDNQRVPVNSDDRSKRQGDIPYYGATGQVGYINDFLFNEELVLLGEDGAPFLDKTKPIAYIISGKSWVNNHAHVIRAKSGLANNWFIKYYLDYFNFADFVGGTTRLKLNQSAMKKIPIKLPTQEEQERIANNLKEAINLIEQNKIKTSKARSIIDRFRQSVLSDAITGKLTEDWREININVEPAKVFLQKIEIPQKKKGQQNTILDTDNLLEIPSTWEWVKFEQIGELARGKSKHRPRNDPRLFGGTYPFIQTGDVAKSNGKISEFSQTYNDIGLAQSRLFPKGTLCITIAANIADSGILQIDACFPDSVVGFIPYSPITSADYFFYFINTAKNNLEQFAPATAQKNINLAILNELAIPLPPLEEQKEIIRRVNQYLTLANEIEKQIENAEARVSKLTQAILAKTFNN